MTGHIENITAGENITAPAWVYVNAGDGKAYKANATTSSNPAVGIVFANAVTNGATQILFSDVFEWPGATFTPGSIYFLSATTSGEMTLTSPTNAQPLGYAVSSTGVMIAPKPFTPPSVSSPVTIAQGGTGQITANAALNAFLPSQTGNNGKVLGTNGSNSAWVTASGSVAADTIWDTKGDLAVGTASDTAARLAVGSDGQQIYADAAQSTGLRWGPSVIAPSQLTSDQDDYSPTGWAKANLVLISGDNGIRAITSFAATFTGDRKTLSNTGSFPLYIPEQHPDGTAANRAVCGGRDYMLFAGASVDIVYDGTNSRWRVLGKNSIDEYDVSYLWSYGASTAGDQPYPELSALGTASSITSTSAASGMPGYLSFSTGSTSTGSVRATITEGGTDFGTFGDCHSFFEAVVSVGTLSDGTDTYTLYILLDDNAFSSSFGNNCTGVRYSHGVNSGKFEGFSRDNGGSESTVDLGITVSGSTHYKVRVEIDKAKTESRFYIDNVFAGRVTGNMPASNTFGAKLFFLKSVGTTARTCRVHSLRAGAIWR